MKEEKIRTWTRNKYPIEKAFERLALELSLLVKQMRKYFARKPKDKFDMGLKTLEIIIWLFLSYDLLKGIFGGR